MGIADNYVRLVLNAGAVVMLSIAVFGDPPYAFFGYLRWVVAAACAGAAWVLWHGENWVFRSLSVLAVASGAIEMFAHFRRQDWFWPNLITAGIIVLSSFCELLTLWAAKTEREIINGP